MSMQKPTRLKIFLAALLFVPALSFAFSFDFGDDDDDWWRYSYWGNPNQPWVTPSGHYFYPRLPYFQRQRMVDRRQDQMAYRRNAMDELRAMLYGRGGFDRAEAIKLARGIESVAGNSLADNFHPGSIATYSSRTTLALWGSPDAFRAKALTLQAAANALAKELEKQPTAEQGAVFLAQRPAGYGKQEKKVAVSPDVWEKFNSLSQECDSCHRAYRGYGW